jgi:peroxiredoxin
MVFVNRFILLVFVIMFAGCGNMMDDLFPSSSNKVPPVQQGTTGPAVGQFAPDFTLSDTLGNSVTLSSVLPGTQGVVMYFTMWCPICSTDMTDMQNSIIPGYPNVRFFAVDYVSGTVSEALNSQIANGFEGSAFTVLADTHQTVLNLYQATMGTTVVIDKTGVIQMNENYKNGSRLQSVLASLP